MRFEKSFTSFSFAKTTNFTRKNIKSMKTDALVRKLVRLRLHFNNASAVKSIPPQGGDLTIRFLRNI